MSALSDAFTDVVGTFTGAKQQADAAKQAAGIQAGMSQQGIDEQRRQFDKLVELMLPYVSQGVPAIQQQGALLGLQGAEVQQQVIAGLERSPMFTSLMQQGENAILQNASATGGLRGGNTQAALAQFRPDLLAKVISDQYAKLGGLSQLGQASAAGQASAGLETATNIGSLLADKGAALAGGAMAQGGLRRQVFGDVLNMGKVASGMF